MNKKEFLMTLENGIKNLPMIEKERIYNYYHETLEDRIEDGLSEEDAVNSMEDIESIISQALSEYQIQENKNIEVKKRRGIRYTLLLCASPFIFTLLFLLFTMYLTLWFLFLSLLLLLLAFILFVILGVINIIHILSLNFASGIVLLGSILIVIGASPWVYNFIKKAFKALIEIWLYGIAKMIDLWKKAVS